MKDKEKFLLSCDRCAGASVERENVYNNSVQSFSVTTPSPSGGPPNVLRTEVLFPFALALIRMRLYTDVLMMHSHAPMPFIWYLIKMFTQKRSIV
jgi:hypothetical protein